jgi:hypothetical protein
MDRPKALKRLTVLQADAGKEPVPQRKYFHIGQPEVLDDLGECIPMISWVDDNLSRFVVSDAQSSSWGKDGAKAVVRALPNLAVKPNDGIFLVSGPGEDTSVAHPDGKGQMHFVHLGARGRLWAEGLTKIYVYRLEGVQVKALLEKKR